MRNLLKKPVILAGSADWLSEVPSITKKYNNTIHHGIKMTPTQALKQSNEKLAYSNFRNLRVRQQPKFKLGQLVRTADIKRVFSKSDTTNRSYSIYTKTEVIHDTIPSYRIDYLPERYKENPLLSTKLTLEQNNQIMEELKIIQ